MADTREAVEYQRVGRPFLRFIAFLKSDSQEIDEMLSSRMTLDEEEAVQQELADMIAEQTKVAEPKLPNVPVQEPRTDGGDFAFPRLLYIPPDHFMIF